MPFEKGRLGNAIRQSRINNHMTQEELAELVDITPTHMKHLESEHRKPSIEVLFRLAKVLHMSLDELLIPDNEVPERFKQYQEIQLLLRDCNDKELNAVEALLREFVKE